LQPPANRFKVRQPLFPRPIFEKRSFLSCTVDPKNRENRQNVEKSVAPSCDESAESVEWSSRNALYSDHLQREPPPEK